MHTQYAFYIMQKFTLYCLVERVQKIESDFSLISKMYIQNYYLILLQKIIAENYSYMLNIIDTAIKHLISGQSTFMVKGCVDLFDMTDIAVSLIEEH